MVGDLGNAYSTIVRQQYLGLQNYSKKCVKMNKKKQIDIFIGGFSGCEKDIGTKYDIVWNVNYNIENRNNSLGEVSLAENLVSINPALDEAAKLVFLGEVMDKIKDVYLTQRYIPRIGKNLPLFWLTGLSQKKPSKTKIVLAYEYAQSVKKLLHRNKAILLGANIKLHCSDPEIEKVLYLFLFNKSEDYGYKTMQPKVNIKQVVIKCIKPFGMLVLAMLNYFSLFIYYKKNIINKQAVISNKNKRILAVVDNNWELKFKDKHVDSIYWPKLSKLAESQGYTMVWLPLLRVRCSETRRRMEYLLRSEFKSVNVTLKDCIAHFKQLFFNVVFLIKNRFIAKSYVFDEVDLTSIVNLETQHLVLSSSLKMSLYYSLIESSAKDADLIIERKPFNALGRVLLYACNDTPVIGMQHGVVNNSQLGYVFTQNELDISPRTKRFDRCQAPNVMGVFGNRMVGRMVANNYPVDWLAVIGDMKFSGAKYEQSLPRQFEVHKCMFVLQYNKSFVENWLPVVASSMLRQHNYVSHVVIKPHPQQASLGLFAKDLLLSLGYNEEFISVSTEPFITAVEKVDIVVSHSSTAIIESLYKGKPVLLIKDNSYENDNSLFCSAACCFPFSNSAEFCESLEVIKELSVTEWDDARKNFLTYNIENIRSDPYKNFFKLCNSVVSESYIS